MTDIKWYWIILLIWLGINAAYLILAIKTGKRREKLGAKYNEFTCEWEIPTERSNTIENEGNDLGR